MPCQTESEFLSMVKKYSILLLLAKLHFGIDCSGVGLSSGYLATKSVSGSLITLLGTVEHLRPNTGYSIRVFAGTEVVGYSFNVTTSPSGNTHIFTSSLILTPSPN